MKYHGKKIGIWGFGVTGRSILHYLAKEKLSVFDNKNVSIEDRQFLELHQIPLFNDCTKFLESNDLVIPSPGIDLTAWDQYREKFVAELDLFFFAWKGPIIAVTGTVGKTTVTHLLAKILEAQGYRIALGGNIGTGMLDLIKQREHSDYALLELSSFQLEHCRFFAPDLAIVTNLYPNHLDRHRSLEQYARAKYKIIAHQDPSRHSALIHSSLLERFQGYDAGCGIQREYRTVCSTNGTYTLAHLEGLEIPSVSYPINWLTIAGALDMLGLNHVLTHHHALIAELPDHRCEFVGSFQDISFYNDSKATIPEATLAALQRFKQSQVILLVGGTSKGIDRSAFFNCLDKEQIRHLPCFGGEAEQLAAYGRMSGLSATAHTSLEEAFRQAMLHAQSGDIVLFSPAGASYDLFRHYQERGARFKELVMDFVKSVN